MALPAYLTLTGTSQGAIKGSVTQKGREGKILVIGVMHEIVSPRDPASGQPTGKRTHKPLIIQKEVDRATPALFMALVNNEQLPSVQIQFYRPGKDGLEKHAYTVTLTNATVSSTTQKMANTRHPKLAQLPLYEEVAFTYQKIEWVWTEGNLSAEDDWESPRV